MLSVLLPHPSPAEPGYSGLVATRALPWSPEGPWWSEASMSHRVFHNVAPAHPVPEQRPVPKALITLVAPAGSWSRPRRVQVAGRPVGAEGIRQPPLPSCVPVRGRAPLQLCFPAGFAVTAVVCPCSGGAGSPGVSRRSRDAGGGLGRPPGAAETAGCCY